jgi:hypothetical protein
MRYTLYIEHKDGLSQHDLGVYAYVGKYGQSSDTYKELYEKHYGVPYASLTTDEKFKEPWGFIQDDESLIPIPSYRHAFILLPNREVHQELETGWNSPQFYQHMESEQNAYKCFKPIGDDLFEFAGLRVNDDGMRLWVHGMVKEFGTPSLPSAEKYEESEKYIRDWFFKPSVERTEVLAARYKAAEDFITDSERTYCEWGQGESGGVRYEDVMTAIKIASGL